MVPAHPTGTVTFLYTDIQDSALLAQQFPAELPNILARHKDILRSAIESNHGHIFRIAGDNFCAAFFTAMDALRAAVQAQRLLYQEDWQRAVIKVRMGIHTGPAQASSEEEIAGGYSGYLTLTRVQRIMATAYGGQILVSEASAALLNKELLDGIMLRDMGEQRLKGLLNPERLFQVVCPDFPSDFPPLASLNAVPNNLPVQLTSFIGRKRELADVIQLLKTIRLLTLTGVGGAGKTRLSLQAASEVLEEFPDGVWLVELASLADPALLEQRTATTLGIHEVPGRPLSIALVDYLRAKKLLLLLDNCEHIVRACAGLAEHLLLACPELHILASSREALGIGGETILQVPSLALPNLKEQPTLDELNRSDAVQLFLERTRAVKPGFELKDSNATAIVQICERLDGIPLAIELAAARLKLFSVEQILARLDDRFRLLTGGSRTALPRQQTLRALIDWSYDLLPEPEQVVLRRLSVFAGGWSYEAAEEIIELDGNPSLDLLECLSHLIDKSLVMTDEPGSNGEATRYRFLETIRQYAGEKLVEAEEAGQLRDRHLDFYVHLAEDVEPKLGQADQLHWLNELETEHDNLRAALAWGLENHPEAALRLAGALSNFWNMRGYVTEGRGWLSKAISIVEALPAIEGPEAVRRVAARVKALIGSGLLMMSQGDNEKAIGVFEESIILARGAGEKRLLVRSLALYGTTAAYFLDHPTNAMDAVEEGVAISREIGDDWSLAMSLGILSNYFLAHGDLKTAQKYLHEGIRIIQKIGDPWNMAMILMGSGMASSTQGNYSEAQERFEQALALFRKIGDKYRVNMSLSELAHINRRVDNYEKAIPLYRESIRAWKEFGHRSAVAHQLECFAYISKAYGINHRAIQLLGAAAAIREAAANPMTALERQEYDAAIEALHKSVDDETFILAWEAGQAMPMDAAIGLALEPIEVQNK